MERQPHKKIKTEQTSDQDVDIKSELSVSNSRSTALMTNSVVAQVASDIRPIPEEPNSSSSEDTASLPATRDVAALLPTILQSLGQQSSKDSSAMLIPMAATPSINAMAEQLNEMLSVPQQAQLESLLTEIVNKSSLIPPLVATRVETCAGSHCRHVKQENG